MKQYLNTQHDFLSQSPIRYMSLLCAEKGGINLSQGVCDTPLPELVGEAAKQAITSGANSYTRCDGLVELKEAIADKAREYNNIECDPEKNIVVSCGATGAFFIASLALLRPDDEVVVFEPYYEYHVNMLKALGVKPIFVPMAPPDWRIDMTLLEESITSKTKAILINTPGNPSGKVFGADELEAIAEICERRDLLVFTDEIYEYLVFDGRHHLSPASIPSLRDRTITISGYSKTFSATGWRIGYCICHEDLSPRIAALNDLFYICAPAPLQIGVTRGIRDLPPSYYENIRSDYEVNRDMICGTLNEIGLTPYVPQGAYYILLDASDVPGHDSKEKALYILDKTGVALVPGRAFFRGEHGENTLRLCFAKERHILERACEDLKRLRF